MKFWKKRTDGQTNDGSGADRKGLVDVIKYNGGIGDLVWKFPYDNITTSAQLIVNQSQEAIFLKGGEVCDVFGPGTHTLSAKNIPILQNLVNLPFGGKTPFTAEVWFVNQTVKRDLKWGTKNPIKLQDPKWNIAIPVRGYGEFGIKIKDSTTFLKQIVGTQHLTSADDIIAQFKSLILKTFTNNVSKLIVKDRISVLEIPAHLDVLSDLCKNNISAEFAEYGIEIINFDVASVNSPDDDPGVMQVNKALANSMQRNVEGYTYQEERSLDVMETAAGNEGASGNIMGAGMGLGMGLGMGGVMGTQMGNIGSVINTNQVPPPPPPPSTDNMSFYVMVNNEQHGPYDLATLKQYFKNGHITADSMIWRQGMGEWIKAIECSDLAFLSPSTTPPPSTGVTPPPPPSNS